MQLRLKKISANLAGRSELSLALIFLLLIFAVRAISLLTLYRAGYLEYDGDGFTRSVHAWEWLQQPRFEIDAWLPLQFWLNGSLMNFWPDLFWEPRVVNIIASLITIVNFFFIGRWLFGKWQGYATAALIGLFPWEIRFSLSGMAESLTYMFLSLGLAWFVRWLQTNNLRHLTFASLGLLGATMLRYEAWFYSLIYAVVVLFIAYRRKTFNWKILPILALTFVFAAIWMLASWLQLGKPWAFVSITSEINANLEGRNREYDLIERLIFYPRILFELMPRLVIPAVIGSLLLIWLHLSKRGRQRPALEKNALPYLVLVWGQLILFILTTLPTNNIAPGSARYPVSNLTLLVPVVVWLADYFMSLLPSFNFKAAVAGLLVLLTLSFIPTTMDRAAEFPQGEVRQIALWFKDQTESSKLPKNIVIPTHLPNPKAENGGDYGYIYALTVLTNRPDGARFPGSKAQGLRVISELEGFQRTIVDDKPLVWLNIDTAGDKAAIQELAAQYRENNIYGQFLVNARPLFRPLTATPSTGNLAQEFRFMGDGYEPGEKISVWVSFGNSVKNLPEAIADKDGKIAITFKPDLAVTQSLTAKGRTSGRTGAVEIVVTP